MNAVQSLTTQNLIRIIDVYHNDNRSHSGNIRSWHIRTNINQAMNTVSSQPVRLDKDRTESGE